MNLILSIVFIIITLSVSPIWGKDKLSPAESSYIPPSAYQDSITEKTYLYQFSPRKLLVFWLRFPDFMFDKISESEWQLHAEIQEKRESLKRQEREAELQKQLRLLDRQLKRRAR